jgi:T4 gene Gp59 loader of gp41 DNA helicase/T4 gene Gp59 loader of gp41 DNA helicase C-term
MSGYVAYCMYHSLKLHFTTENYDYIKFHGKTRVNQDSFMRDKSRFTYYKLSRKYNEVELKDFYVANFIDGRTGWAGDLLSVEADDCYTKWSKKMQSISYQFEQDLDTILSKGMKGLLTVKPGEHPELLVMAMQRKINVESIIIMNKFMNFIPMWKERIDDDLLWPKLHNTMVKYRPFIHCDEAKMKVILVKKVKEYACQEA